jgi:hypothetical protein
VIVTDLAWLELLAVQLMDIWVLALPEVGDTESQLGILVIVQAQFELILKVFVPPPVPKFKLDGFTESWGAVHV